MSPADRAGQDGERGSQTRHALALGVPGEGGRQVQARGQSFRQRHALSIEAGARAGRAAELQANGGGLALEPLERPGHARQPGRNLQPKGDRQGGLEQGAAQHGGGLVRAGQGRERVGQARRVTSDQRRAIARLQHQGRVREVLASRALVDARGGLGRRHSGPQALDQGNGQRSGVRGGLGQFGDVELGRTGGGDRLGVIWRDQPQLGQGQGQLGFERQGRLQQRLVAEHGQHLRRRGRSVAQQGRQGRATPFSVRCRRRPFRLRLAR